MIDCIVSKKRMFIVKQIVKYTLYRFYLLIDDI